FQVDALVPALRVEGGLPAEPLLGDGPELAGELHDLDTLHSCPHGLPRHLAVEGSAVRKGPALDQVEGRIEAVLLVEDPLHQRRHCQDPLRRLAVGGAQLDVALQPDLREERRQMEAPVVERRALAGEAALEEAPEGYPGYLREVPPAPQHEVERYVERPL